jgi:hypothetical protein
MAKYPDWAVGTDVSATNLALMVPNIVVKTATETVNNTATYQSDDELAGLALGVGTWWVKFHLFVTCSTSATPDIKTKWLFSGTSNNAVRMVKGPGPTNTGARDALTPMHSGGILMGNDAVYGLAASTAFVLAEEETFALAVTVAGNLDLQWAQNTASATNTNVHAGSTVTYRQIAA